LRRIVRKSTDLEADGKRKVTLHDETAGGTCVRITSSLFLWRAILHQIGGRFLYQGREDSGGSPPTGRLLSPPSGRTGGDHHADQLRERRSPAFPAGVALSLCHRVARRSIRLWRTKANRLRGRRWRAIKAGPRSPAPPAGGLRIPVLTPTACPHESSSRDNRAASHTVVARQLTADQDQPRRAQYSCRGPEDQVAVFVMRSAS